MAVYRFKVCLEDNEDIVRDIEIKAAQTFEQFHTIIQEAFKFDAKHAASFFVSDDYWRKGQEITLNKEDLPLDEEDIRSGVGPKKLMSEARIAKYIEQPHQRFVYVFDPAAQWSFLIEMIKINEENNKINYPSIVKSIGNPPKQYKQVPVVKEEAPPVSKEDALLGALFGARKKKEEVELIEEEEEEVYKTIETAEEGIEEDDIQSLEGEEGEEETADGEEGEENASEGEDYGFGEDEEHEH